MSAVALAILTIIFGVTALWIARRARALILRSRDWPTVQGRILERGVGEAMGARRSYLPRVKYTYSVGGKSFTGDQVYQIRRTGWIYRTVRKLVDGLPEEIAVHYNPENPAESYLLWNPWGTVLIALIFGIGAILFGLLQLLAVWGREAGG